MPVERGAGSRPEYSLCRERYGVQGTGGLGRERIGSGSQSVGTPGRDSAHMSPDSPTSYWSHDYHMIRGERRRRESYVWRGIFCRLV